jgi:hypothetical protein
MPSPLDSDPKFWAGLQLPLNHKFFDRKYIDGVARNIGKSTEAEIVAPMPVPDGTRVNVKVPVWELLVDRLDRLSHVYILEKSEAKMPTPNQERAALKSIEANLMGLVRALGISIEEVEKPRGASDWTGGTDDKIRHVEIAIPPAIRKALEPHVKDIAFADAAPEIMADLVRAEVVELDIRTGALRRVLTSLYVLRRAVDAAQRALDGAALLKPEPELGLLERLETLYEFAFKEPPVRRQDREKQNFGPFVDFAEAICRRIATKIEDINEEGADRINVAPPDLSHEAINARLERRDKDRARLGD